MEERQKQFFDHKTLTPLVLFPEGTTTSGRNILRMKKGAFYSLLPVKPVMVRVHQEDEIILAVGSSNIVVNYFRSICFLYHRIEFIDLPVIIPTEYMFEKYKDLGEEKWMVYAGVVQKMYCEIGGFKESNKNLRDSLRYQKMMETRTYIEPSKDD